MDLTRIVYNLLKEVAALNDQKLPTTSKVLQSILFGKENSVYFNYYDKNKFHEYFRLNEKINFNSEDVGISLYILYLNGYITISGYTSTMNTPKYSVTNKILPQLDFGSFGNSPKDISYLESIIKYIISFSYNCDGKYELSEKDKNKVELVFRDAFNNELFKFDYNSKGDFRFLDSKSTKANLIKNGNIGLIKNKIHSKLFIPMKRECFAHSSFEDTLSKLEGGSRLLDELSFINKEVKKYHPEYEERSDKNRFCFYEKNYKDDPDYGFILRVVLEDNKLLIEYRKNGKRNTTYEIFHYDSLQEIGDFISGLYNKSSNDFAKSSADNDEIITKIGEMTKKINELQELINALKNNPPKVDNNKEEIKREIEAKPNEIEDILDKEEVCYGELIYDSNPRGAKVLVVGQPAISLMDIKKCIQNLGLDMNRFDFVLNYESSNSLSNIIDSIKNGGNKYCDIMFGPIPHKIKNMGDGNSLISILEKENNVANIVRITCGGVLKISKTSFLEALKKTVFYKKQS